jgi:CheY-like chemotaxis protein
MTSLVSLFPASTPEFEPFVLLVDDQEICLSLLRDLLESAGHRCVTAHSATDALLCCDTCQPQLVVTDLMMPGLDGHVLCHWMKARYPTMPLVLVTGQDLDGPALAWLRLTFRAILTKPVDPRRLLRLLDELIPECRGANPDQGAGDAECLP